MNIVLAVTGGIAAYKTPDLIRRLRERGAVVRPVMTDAARAFIAPLTLQAVSGHAVPDGLLDSNAEPAMGHIELSRWADVVLVAPASADFMARLAHGLAGDLPSTLCLATTAPIVLAPAMNQQMWQAAATQDNRALLERRGVRMLGPGEGDQACGEVGPGRMLEPLVIAEALLASSEGALAGLSVLVTAGPTREALDPVRFISNHSSGKMGYAVARAAQAAGARVTLVSGPTALAAPVMMERVSVESADQMFAAVLERVDAADVFIGTAAVADYKPVTCHASKMKKSGDGGLVLELAQNPDIIASVTARARRPFTVGFAAETDDLERNAQEKLRRKHLDLIVANRVGLQDRGFNSDDNAATLIWAEGEMQLTKQDKYSLAHAVLQQVSALFVHQLAHTNPTDMAD